MSPFEMMPSDKTSMALGEEASSHVAMQACRLPLPTRIAFIGNYLPRECGIATFTTDLCTALATEYGEGRLFAIPVDDPDSTYDYTKQVRLELEQENIASYERALTFSTSTATIFSVCNINTASTAAAQDVTF
jgi:hypothetical protein